MIQKCKTRWVGPVNARFWVWVGGPVKITLRPGQQLRYAGFCRIGSHHLPTVHNWRHDGLQVARLWLCAGRDRHGWYAHYAATVCPLTQLGTGSQDPHWSEVRYAVWRQVIASEWREPLKGGP